MLHSVTAEDDELARSYGRRYAGQDGNAHRSSPDANTRRAPQTPIGDTDRLIAAACRFGCAGVFPRGAMEHDRNVAAQPSAHAAHVPCECPRNTGLRLPFPPPERHNMVVYVVIALLLVVLVVLALSV